MIAKRQDPCLFLYGSLLTGTPDRRLNKRVRRLLRHAQHAMIQARLYNIGRYPGVVPSHNTADRVYGRLIAVSNPHLLKLLDRYEDAVVGQPVAAEFVRVLIPAQLLPTRKRINCYVYVYNRDIIGKQRIISGDYVLHKKTRRKWSRP